MKTLILLCLLTAPLAIADDLIVTGASIAPSVTLPGLPFWVRLEIQNSGDQAQALPRKYVVEVTPRDSKPFLVAFATTTTALLPEEFVTLGPIQPGESRVLEFPSSPGLILGDGIPGDPRLWKQNTYQLRLVLSDEINGGELSEYRWHELHGSGRIKKAPLVTPAIRLIVEEPSGLDATAWKTLSDPKSKAWMLMGPRTDELVASYWADFAASRYAPYIGLAYAESIIRSGRADRFEVAERLGREAAALDSEGVVTEAVRVLLAYRLTARAQEAQNLAAGLKLLNDGRSELAELAASATHELNRLRAKSSLMTARTPEQLTKQFAARNDKQ